MGEKQLQEVFEEGFGNVRPSDKRKEQLWKEIVKMEKMRKKPHMWLKGVAAAAVFALVFLCGMTGVNAASGGKVAVAGKKAISAVKEALGIDQGKQDVVTQVASLPKKSIEVYAPDILAIDEKSVLFGSQRGLVLFGLEEDALLGTIDLQEIGCFYFNTDQKKTHVLREGNKIIIFNSESGKPYGKYYIFNMKKAALKDWAFSDSGSDEKALGEYYVKWEEAQADYVDTFDRFEDIGITSYSVHPNDVGPYSEKSICWKTASGREQISYLTVGEEYTYVLNTYIEENGTTVERTLDFSGVETEDSEDIVLPEFEYTGEDAVMAAICEYMEKRDRQMYASDGKVWIPAFIEYGRFEEGDEVVVFGNFWSFCYMLSGNVLENESGGEAPARFTLKEGKNGYKVTDVVFTGDGDQYEKGIQEFTEGYRGMYEAFFKEWDDGKERDECRMYFLKMYVESNGLDIRYYKDYGWDPVEIK